MDLSGLRDYWVGETVVPPIPVFRAVVDWSGCDYEGSDKYPGKLLWCIDVDSAEYRRFGFYARYYDGPCSLDIPDIGEYSAVGKSYSINDIAKLVEDGRVATAAISLAMEASL